MVGSYGDIVAAAVNSATVNVGVSVSLWCADLESFRQTPRSGTAGSQGRSIVSMGQEVEVQLYKGLRGLPRGNRREKEELGNMAKVHSRRMWESPHDIR